MDPCRTRFSGLLANLNFWPHLAKFGQVHAMALQQFLELLKGPQSDHALAQTHDQGDDFMFQPMSNRTSPPKYWWKWNIFESTTYSDMVNIKDLPGRKAMDFGVRSCCPGACVFPCLLPGPEIGDSAEQRRTRECWSGASGCKMLVSHRFTQIVLGILWQLPSCPYSWNGEPLSLKTQNLTTSVCSLPIRPGRACEKSILLNSGRAVDVPVAAWSITYQVQKPVVAGQTRELDIFDKTPRSNVLHSMSTCQLQL